MQYADDTVSTFLNSGNEQTIIQNIQKGIDMIEIWCTLDRMKKSVNNLMLVNFISVVMFKLMTTQLRQLNSLSIGRYLTFANHINKKK